jgi:hypothetical protein
MAAHDPQTFRGGSWIDVAAMMYLGAGGIILLSYTQSGFVALGAVLLVIGIVGILGCLGGRRLDISDSGVTTHRVFRWSRTYPWPQIHHATVDWRFVAYPRSVPTLFLNNGREIHLWSMSQPTLLRFRTHKRTASMIETINLYLGYRMESATGHPREE